MSQNTTIIVPIYNAYQDTKQCIESIIKCTDSKHKIILIDDASTDEKIPELTLNFSSNYSHITSFRNSKNLGFVKTCNFGFSLENTNDIVLLNSDTLVTPNWLEQIIAAAYSNPQIATVTPLTNNGTICSVPKWLEYNDLPQNHTVETFAELINKTSLRKYPTIPTAVGFCMYIKQQILQEIGYFDDVTFGRGYCEENDFCCRASAVGYLHIIDDNTFVYHSGSKSFSQEKEILVKSNYEKLKQKHPNYFSIVAEFVEKQPLKDILENIELQLKLFEITKKKPILFLLHNSIDNSTNHLLGGTERHCKVLVDHLSNEYPIGIFYVWLQKQAAILDIYFQANKISFCFPLINKSGFNSLFHSELSNIFRNIIVNFQFSIVHIHHLITFPLADIYDMCQESKIPYIISLHDYHNICPRYNLLDWKSKFCFEYKSESYCKQCMLHYEFNDEYRYLWSNNAQKGLEKAELLITPSETSKSYFVREYPSLKDNLIKVIGHGIYSRDYIESINDTRQIFIKNRIERVIKDNYQMKIVFVGSILTHKGGDVIKELFKKIASNSTLQRMFKFKIVGQVNFEVNIDAIAIENVSNYEPQDLIYLLEDTDIAVFPTIWAETYCLTVDEALLAGVPVITNYLGAPSERLKNWNTGWICDNLSSEILLDLLIKISNDKQSIIPLLKNLLNINIKNYEEMAIDYKKVYSSIIPKSFRENEVSKSDNILIFQGYKRYKEFNNTNNVEQSSLNNQNDEPDKLHPNFGKFATQINIRWIKSNFPSFWKFGKKVIAKINQVLSTESKQ